MTRFYEVDHSGRLYTPSSDAGGRVQEGELANGGRSDAAASDHSAVDRSVGERVVVDEADVVDRDSLRHALEYCGTLVGREILLLETGELRTVAGNAHRPDELVRLTEPVGELDRESGGRPHGGHGVTPPRDEVVVLPIDERVPAQLDGLHPTILPVRREM